MKSKEFDTALNILLKTVPPHKKLPAKQVPPVKKPLPITATEDKKAYILKWLKKRKDVLNISAIGRKTGCNTLYHIVNEIKDGHGRVATLADRHVEMLLAEIKYIKS